MSSWKSTAYFSPDYVSSITFKDTGKKEMWIHYITTHG